MIAPNLQLVGILVVTVSFLLHETMALSAAKPSRIVVVGGGVQGTSVVSMRDHLFGSGNRQRLN